MRIVWASVWPKLMAAAIALVLWQLAYVYYHQIAVPRNYLFPDPVATLKELRDEAGSSQLWTAIAITGTRAAVGYSIAVVLGLLIGVAVVRSRILRRAVGSLITALQTMPSIVWFMPAILLFQLSETAILFVVLLGATPSIANAVILGVDHVSPELVRAGRILGASGLTLYRRVVLPATLPSLVAGMKQAWAFAWRSLMAGELLVIVPGRGSIGARLQNDRDLADYTAMFAMIIVLLVIGILIDALFSLADSRIRRRRGLVNQQV